MENRKKKQVERNDLLRHQVKGKHCRFRWCGFLVHLFFPIFLVVFVYYFVTCVVCTYGRLKKKRNTSN